jgi:hypothetical protein
VIDYPDDRASSAEAKRHGLDDVVLIRDLARIVEVLNLDSQDFFSAKSVMAGSMALRCYGSPRFTVFDADFSTTHDRIEPINEMHKKFSYTDDEIEIDASALVSDDHRETLWKSAPIRFNPFFSQLVPNEGDQRFKADISVRGLIHPGIEKPLRVPYDLGLWRDPPPIWIMDPHEILAEKILGWCVNQLAKHYADVAFICLIADGTDTIPAQIENWSWHTARDTLDAKLGIMRRIYPQMYAQFRSVDALLGPLSLTPEFDAQQWDNILYLRSQRDRFRQQFVINAVQEILVPNLRLTGRR